ncbi:LysE/ArgO family amino acid transporter [Arthrobacter bambusae]|uniref:L-lysine exporter family protein LysE/ArgO n=2 Tax=Arthrobacter TaxID=1663 RepID=A0AAW8DDX2_9MICC|nr:LysE/ArgO family amino acid transporter [Arthrobacter bambusae]MDP9906532.1 L-lysine exporter family protein LysE/ArgO [Arthrobacter bambusae]MDQ0130030.1 L-lysine exporter family protein LysE/ArgO [Arthrobacter bambusae]MDQ0181410.1 L-lysine exporter family protein LysE/ArgO [Arthrobacter bambusae]
MNSPDVFHAAGLGLGTGLALIVAIGAQNAFVLRQGIRGEHIGAVVAVCAISDAVLIAAGVLGTGALLAAAPAAVVVLRYVGAAFLVTYGVMAARRILRPQALVSAEPGPSGAGRSGLASALATVMALTWLNPHVYLDTVLLLGSVANAQGPGLQWWFGAGAMLGSILWFCSLGFGAKLLRGFFARPASWRILDGGIAATMVGLGVGLALGS